MLAVAQDAQGTDRVRPILEDADVTFPLLLDRASALARDLGFRMVPSGFFVDAEGWIRYRHVDDFDIGDARVRWNLERFLVGEETEPSGAIEHMTPGALELFAEGTKLLSQERPREAVALWREALKLDVDNFLIRSQIWAIEHPEHFYPTVDLKWQELQLAKEGYERPLQ